MTSVAASVVVDESVEETKTVSSLSAKEIKALAKPEFAANPDKVRRAAEEAAAELSGRS